MIYRNYTIAAAVNAYQEWEVLENGLVVEPLGGHSSDVEVCGYNVYDTESQWVEFAEGDHLEDAKLIVDTDLLRRA
ncbi:hypothetical protein [Subtercola sp. RTI3]|uniref:hypothetical protein n=1 Tax=Subtercola sp. RTI3 TaxID=3048639 RepID=UPI002B227B96|nr:hypothetical protein [Subtercola sp. RTI3]MEA9985665.1 hypothetical protein [Subtercola sp. RTI3]